MTQIVLLDNYRLGRTSAASGGAVSTTTRGTQDRPVDEGEVLSLPVARSSAVVGIFPIDEALIRLAGAIWGQPTMARRYGP
jgi:hypothetical protein